jgi:hypothetical protein
MSMVEILEALERDRVRHLFAGPAGEDELRRLEHTLGLPLPLPFRSFLARVGGALLFDCHEVFGPHPVMIHDIDLVPDILTFRHLLEREGHRLPPDSVPVHRCEGRVHLLYLREPGMSGRVVALDLSASYPDFAAFMRAVVLPARGSGGQVAC